MKIEEAGKSTYETMSTTQELDRLQLSTDEEQQITISQEFTKVDCNDAYENLLLGRYKTTSGEYQHLPAPLNRKKIAYYICSCLEPDPNLINMAHVLIKAGAYTALYALAKRRRDLFEKYPNYNLPYLIVSKGEAYGHLKNRLMALGTLEKAGIDINHPYITCRTEKRRDKDGNEREVEVYSTSDLPVYAAMDLAINNSEGCMLSFFLENLGGRIVNTATMLLREMLIKQAELSITNSDKRLATLKLVLNCIHTNKSGRKLSDILSLRALGLMPLFYTREYRVDYFDPTNQLSKIIKNDNAAALQCLLHNGHRLDLKNIYGADSGAEVMITAKAINCLRLIARSGANITSSDLLGLRCTFYCPDVYGLPTVKSPLKNPLACLLGYVSFLLNATCVFSFSLLAYIVFSIIEPLKFIYAQYRALTGHEKVANESECQIFIKDWKLAKALGQLNTQKELEDFVDHWKASDHHQHNLEKLISIATNGNASELAEFLSDTTVNIDAKKTEFNNKNNCFYEVCALSVAIENGHDNVVKFLLEREADVNITLYSYTIGISSVLYCRNSASRMTVLERKTPLSLALLTRRFSAANMLLNAGADAAERPYINVLPRPLTPCQQEESIIEQYQSSNKLDSIEYTLIHIAIYKQCTADTMALLLRMSEWQPSNNHACYYDNSNSNALANKIKLPRPIWLNFNCAQAYFKHITQYMEISTNMFNNTNCIGKSFLCPLMNLWYISSLILASVIKIVELLISLTAYVGHGIFFGSSIALSKMVQALTNSIYALAFACNEDLGHSLKGHKQLSEKELLDLTGNQLLLPFFSSRQNNSLNTMDITRINESCSGTTVHDYQPYNL